MKIRTIIVDDEKSSRDNVRKALELYCSDIDIAGEADSVGSAVELITQAKPDLVFLDIEIRDGLGFDILQSFSTIDFNVIFITGHDHYAVKAFRYSAIDYLLKPFDTMELIAAVNKVRKANEKESFARRYQLMNENEHTSRKKLALPTFEGLSMVCIEDIVRCESDNSYTTFFIKNKHKLIVSKSIGEFEELLTFHQFFRAHQSHLINLREVKNFLKDDGGIVVLSDLSRVPVARRRKEQLMELLMGL